MVKPITAKKELITIGNDTIGKVSLYKLGYLTDNEINYVKDRLESNIDLRDYAFKLAKNLSTKMGKSEDIIIRSLINGDISELGGSILELLKFNDEITEINQKRYPIFATAILSSRYDNEWTLEHTKNPEYIHPLLVELLAEFYLQENEKQINSQETAVISPIDPIKPSK